MSDFHISPQGVRSLEQNIADLENTCSESVFRHTDQIIDTLTNHWVSQHASDFGKEAGACLQSMYTAVYDATRDIGQRVNDVIAYFNAQEGNYCYPMSVNTVHYPESVLDSGTPTTKDGDFGTFGVPIQTVFNSLRSSFEMIVTSYKTYLDDLVSAITSAAAFDSGTTSYIRGIATTAKGTLETEMGECLTKCNQRLSDEESDRSSAQSSMSS